jgi:hypothetical protein
MAEKVRKRLWNNFDGEPYLDNPSLYIVGNPRIARGEKTVARKRNAKGRFVKSNPQVRAYRVKTYHRRPKAKRRLAARAYAANPRKRRTRRIYAANPVHRHRRTRRYAGNPSRSSHRRRGYRRNPVLGGLFSPQNLKLAGYTAGGLIGTPILANVGLSLVGSYVPVSNQFVRYGVQIGAAAGISWGISKLAGNEAGKAALIGGLAFVVVQVLNDFGVISALNSAASAMLPTTAKTSKYLTAGRTFGRQPLLGRYPSMGSLTTSQTVSRLNPASRY